MKGIATSDLHLGFAGAGRMLNGRSGRQQDVEKAWHQAVDLIVFDQPELVTIAGDVYHSISPSFHAIRAFHEGIRRIVGVTKAHVVIIGGNHETPRTVAALTPTALLAGEYERVHVVTEPMQVVRFESGNSSIAVTCFPFNALAPAEVHPLAPDPFSDVNVLLLHAAVRTSAVEGALPTFYGTQGIDIGREVDQWDVIACGDFHDFTRLHPSALAFYSGAIERTTSNIWQEQPKGIVRYDTFSGVLELLEIPTREVYDLVIAEPANAEGVNHVLAGLAARPLNDCMVRLRLSCDRGERERIDWQLVRDLKHLCFHFLFDVTWTANAISLGDRRDNGRTLTEVANEFFAADPAEVRETALRYLTPEAA